MSAELFGVKEASLIRAIYRMDDDMYRLGRSGEVEPEYLPHLYDYGDKPDAQNFHDFMLARGYVTARIITKGAETTFPPQTKFGKTLLAASEVADCKFYQRPDEQTCTHTEPMLIASLETHTPNSIPDNETIGQTAVILLDKDDKPIGYQKSVGIPSTYLWEPANVQTQAGDYTLPGDSFHFFDFTDQIYDKWTYAKAGLIAVTVNPETTLEAGISRMSAVTYPPTVRKAMAVSAGQMDRTLSDETLIAKAVSFKPSDVARKVSELLSTGLVAVYCDSDQ